MIDKPSENEEEYIARMEFERKKKTEMEKQNMIAQEEKKRLRELHFMKCPKCGMELIEIDYKGAKIDECSGCRGIGLMPASFRLFRNLRNQPLISSSVSLSSKKTGKTITPGLQKKFLNRRHSRP